MEQTQNSKPDWVPRIFRNFLDHTRVLAEVLELTCGGISMVRATPNAIRALGKYSGDESDHVRAEIAAAERRAALAQREVDSGFHIVHSQAVVSLWSSLEDVIRTFVAQWLINVPETRANPPWSVLKVTVGEYEQLDDEEKAYLLVGLIEQNTAAALKGGVNRFECLLGHLGLSGPVAKKVRDSLYEMQQVRNVIAHTRGVADTRFCKSCPGFTLRPGDALLVSHKMFNRYFDAVHSYILEVIFRSGEKFGDTEMRAQSNRSYESDVSEQPPSATEESD
jgi:hypothetical protein